MFKTGDRVVMIDQRGLIGGNEKLYLIGMEGTIKNVETNHFYIQFDLGPQYDIFFYSQFESSFVKILKKEDIKEKEKDWEIGDKVKTPAGYTAIIVELNENSAKVKYTQSGWYSKTELTKV